MSNYYEMLGLKSDATAEQIKSAYRKLSLKFHPDKNDGDNYFSEWAKKINEAYEILGNPSKKLAYDKQLKKDENTSNSNSYRNTNNSINEYKVLSQIRDLTPAFLNAKSALANAQHIYNRAASKKVPNKFTATRILFIIFLFLVSAYGFKNMDFNQILNFKSTSVNTNSRVTAKSGLVIRDNPSVEGNEITVAPHNAKLNVIDNQVASDYISGKSGNWYQVEYNGKTGYAWGNLIMIEL